MIALRPATMDDADLLLSMRNHPTTREWFRDTGEVTPLAHNGWMNVRMNNPDHQLMVALDDDVPVGSIRADRTPSKHEGYEVSITISPVMRQAGLGKKVLRAACEHWGNRFLYAEIKYNNIASMKIFRGCLFEQIGSYGLWTQWRRLPTK